MTSNVTPTSKRISHEIAKIDMQIAELSARRKAMWDAQHIAEAYEADIEREAKRKGKLDKEEEERLSRKGYKSDPTRNIVSDESETLRPDSPIVGYKSPS